MRRLQFKFPSQIRISGWDFGSSARAMNQAGGKDSLMTYENKSIPQADLVKVTKSTTERKSMSTKTSIKRIALVAVAGLGLGMLSSVAATAVGTANANVTAITSGTSAPARVNVAGGATTISLTHIASLDTSDTITAQITSAPSTSVNSVLTFASGATKAPSASSYTASSKTDQLASSNNGVARAVITGNAGTSTNLVLTLTADVAGSYTILVTADAASAAGYSAGKLTTSYTITTAGAPTSITAASYGGSVTTSGQYGQLFSFSLKDAAGNPTVVGLNESIDLTDDVAAVTFKDGTSSAGSAVTSFGSSASNVGGKYFFRAVNTGTAIAADGTAVISLTGSGLLPASLTTNISATLKKAVAATTGGTITAAATTAANVTDSAGAAWSSGTMYTTGAQSITWSALTNGSTTADVTLATELSDANGYKYNSTATIAAATTAATTVKATAPAVTSTGANTTIALLTALNGGSAVTATLAYKAPVASAIAISGSSSVLAATGAKSTFAVQATDQYGNGIAYAPVSVAVSGRNTVLTTSIGVTDANGFISYSWTDAGTTGTKDTVTFTSGSLTAATATVTYGTVTVGTVTIKGGNNTTTGVAASTAQWKDIDAGVDGASATTSSVVATVKDASGNLVAGVPVSFTVSGTGAAITSTTATVYTKTDGTATAAVYAWIAGTYTVTATAGGKSGTASYQFRQSAKGEERAISATVSGNLVTAKVVDRFGNGVPGVTVYASVTGGYLGTGALKSTDTTDNDGLVSFIVNGGASTVTLRTYDATVATATPGSGQSCARAGAVDCNALASSDTAFTASVAGTSTVAETGVGASFAAAGVSSVSVDVAAAGASDSVDAANEATDAANAATDAANAAAEAADAATAAAQDAQAAVAALATQVASLIAGIKAQITTLTNLVIKIQKKVRA